MRVTAVDWKQLASDLGLASVYVGRKAYGFPIDLGHLEKVLRSTAATSNRAADKLKKKNKKIARSRTKE